MSALVKVQLLQYLQSFVVRPQSGLNLDGEDLRPLSLGERKEECFAQKLGLSNPQAPPDPRSATQNCRYCCGVLQHTKVPLV